MKLFYTKKKIFSGTGVIVWTQPRAPGFYEAGGQVGGVDLLISFPATGVKLLDRAAVGRRWASRHGEHILLLMMKKTVLWPKFAKSGLLWPLFCLEDRLSNFGNCNGRSAAGYAGWKLGWMLSDLKHQSLSPGTEGFGLPVVSRPCTSKKKAQELGVAGATLKKPIRSRSLVGN